LELQLSAFLARKHVQARPGDQTDLSPLLIKVSGTPKKRRWLNALADEASSLICLPPCGFRDRAQERKRADRAWRRQKR
jgi:hypothetical protein